MLANLGGGGVNSHCISLVQWIQCGLIIRKKRHPSECTISRLERTMQFFSEEHGFSQGGKSNAIMTSAMHSTAKILDPPLLPSPKQISRTELSRLLYKVTTKSGCQCVPVGLAMSQIAVNVCSSVQCEPKNPPEVFLHFFQTVGNFSSKFYTPIIRSYLC